jgi:hypothetical protein
MSQKNEPDYESYTLNDLYDAKSNIDKTVYSDRYTKILKEIEKRELRPNIEKNKKESFPLIGFYAKQIEFLGLKKLSRESIIALGLVAGIPSFIGFLTIFYLIFFRGPSEALLHFRDTAISGKVDSVLVSHPRHPSTSHIWIEGDEFILPLLHRDFAHFARKGDLVIKKEGRWDLTVSRLSGDKVQKKYFRGPQDKYD